MNSYTLGASASGFWQAGGPIRIQVHVAPDSESIMGQILAVCDRIEDMRPVLNVLPEEIIFPAVEELFASEGFGTWQFKGYQSTPPMVKSGLMKRGLTSRDPMLNRVTVTKNSLVFELSPNAFIENSRRNLSDRRRSGQYRGYGVFYPGIHQEGGKRHYQNIVIGLRDEDVAKIEARLLEWITEGR